MNKRNALLALAVVAVRHLLGGRGTAFVLLVAVFAGAAVYLLLAKLQRMEMLSLLWDRRKRGPEAVSR